MGCQSQSCYQFTLICLLFTTILCGCGAKPGQEKEQTVVAEGTATYQGKPLENYRIYLHIEGKRPASGMIDAQGNFKLGTNSEGDGAAPGTHSVGVIYSPDLIETEPGSTVYKDPPPPSVKVPAKFQNPDTSGLTLTVPEEGSQDLKLEIN